MAFLLCSRLALFKGRFQILNSHVRLVQDTAGINFSHIKTNRTIQCITHQILCRRSANAPLFGRADKFPWQSMLCFRPRFDLHKAEHTVPAGNQINLSHTAAKLTRFNAISIPAKIRRHAGFAPVTRQLFCIHCAAPPISPENCADGPDRAHSGPAPHSAASFHTLYAVQSHTLDISLTGVPYNGHG